MVAWSSLIVNFLSPPTFRRPAKIVVKVLGVESPPDLITLLHCDASLDRLVKEGVILIRGDNS